MGNYGDAFGSAIAEQLRAERSAARMSQKQLAAMAGMSEQSVMRYLNGVRDIPMAALADLAEALGLTVETIVNRAAERVTLPSNVTVVRFGDNDQSYESREAAHETIEDDGSDDYN